MKDDHINYARIGHAQSFYRALGYKNVEVPWTVSHDASRATAPPGANLFPTPVGVLIASGEQGFIELMRQGAMAPGKWQTTTPCFRDEKEHNELTRFSFMKTELIWYMPEDNRLAFETVLNNAISCFYEISEAEVFEGVQTAEGVDIYFNGVELGSYGVRTMDKHVWVYGTGLAEPRFSIMMRRQQQIAPFVSMAPSQPHPTEEAQDTSTSDAAQAPA